MAALDEALADARLSTKVRRRIPLTIIRFEPNVAAEILQRHLELDHEGNVRLKILRALNRLQGAHPDIELEHALLDDQLRATLLRICQLMRWRAALEDGESNDSQDSELLIAALHDKERATLQLAFWLMWLQHPDENLVLVWRGLQSENPRLRAASVEVLEAVLSGDIREAVLSLVDIDQPAGGRAATAVAALGQSLPNRSVRDALDDMVADRSEVVRSIASHHLAALGPVTENQEVRTLA